MIGEKSNRICIVLYSVWHDSCTDPALCRAGDFSDPVISFSGISSVLLLENDLSHNPHSVSYTHLDVYKRQSQDVLF